MALPMMNAELTLSRPQDVHSFATRFSPAREGAHVAPQVCVSSACLRLPSGRFCVSLPILGRRCVTIPRLGSWRIRCCTRFGIPPVSCGIASC
jgi:hypothetical protein